MPSEKLTAFCCLCKLPNNVKHNNCNLETISRSDYSTTCKWSH